MRTVRLQRLEAGVRWQATISGCVLEMVRELIDPPKSLVEKRAFESPRLAQEFLEESVGRLLEAGFKKASESRELAAGVAPLGGIIEPQIAAPVLVENAALFADVDREPDAFEPYLVYADWLQEQGDPLGHLIALQHLAEREPLQHAVARRLLQRFGEQLLPGDANASYTWRLGFLETLTCRNGLARFAEHRCTRLLRQLRCTGAEFGALPTSAGFRHVHTIVLEGVEVDVVELLSFSRTPGLRRLLVEDVAEDAVAPLIAALPPSVTVLGLKARYVEDVERFARALDTLPTPHPSLWLDLGEVDANEEIARRIGSRFELLSDLPGAVVLDRTQRSSDEDEATDVMDRMCSRCGNVGPTQDEGRCGQCGGAVPVYDEMDEDWGYDEDDPADHIPMPNPGEVCAHDARRDPNHDAAGSDGVDRRWDAPKPDVFDIDEE